MTPTEFKDRLNRAVMVIADEIRDGCNDCREENGGFCRTHQDLAYDLFISPHQFVEITPDGAVRFKNLPGVPK